MTFATPYAMYIPSCGTQVHTLRYMNMCTTHTSTQKTSAWGVLVHYSTDMFFEGHGVAVAIQRIVKLMDFLTTT